MDIRKSHVRSGKILACMFFICSLLAACSKDWKEIGSADSSISFSAGKVEKSRAMINNPADFKEGAAFGVFGTHFTDGGTLADPVQVFDNIPVTLWGASWGYSDPKYWEYNRHYRFRAFYPYADQNVQNPGYKLTNTFADPDAYEIVNFFINDNVADQVDLMVSNVETRNVTAPGHSAETAPVVFTFHHLLTKINVKIKRSADFAQALNKKVIRITARLYGMKKKGNCVSGVWNTLPADVNPIGFTSSFENKDGLLTSAAAELQLWENGLMLVPQDVNGVKLEVEFVVEHWDTATPPKLTKTTTETQLMTLPTTVEWANAKQITYMAQIEANSNIVFLSPKVEPWVEAGSSNSIVIK